MLQGNVLEFVWGSVEMALNVLLYSRLRIPQRVQSATFRYNYNFGIDSKTRYVVAIFLLPSLMKHIKQRQHSIHFLYTCYMIYDILIILDVFVSSETIYAIVLMFRVIRFIETFLTIIQAGMTLKIKHTIQTPKKTQLKISPTQSLLTTKANSHEEEEQPKVVVKRIPQLYQYHFILKTSKSQKIEYIQNDLNFESITHQDRKVQLNMKLNLAFKLYERLKKENKDVVQELQKQIAHYFSQLLI